MAHEQYLWSVVPRDMHPDLWGLKFGHGTSATDAWAAWENWQKWNGEVLDRYQNKSWWVARRFKVTVEIDDRHIKGG